MRRTWWQRLPLFMPDDGAASGAAGQAQGNHGQAQQNQQDGQQQGAQGNQSGAAAEGLGNAAAAAQGAQAQQQVKARPEWLGEKYWDATKGEAKVEDLAKAEAAWRAQISRGDHKPPADPSGYKFDFANHADPDIKAAAAAIIVPGEDGSPDPIMKAVQERAHKEGVSQAQLQGIVETFLKGQAPLIPAPFDEKAEMGKLGQNGPALLKTLNDYADQQIKTGRWDENDLGRFRNYLYDAEDAKFLQKVLFDAGLIPEVKIAAMQQAASTPDASQLDAELADINARAAKGENVQALFEANLAKREKLFGKEAQRSWPPPAA
jgi:hypothetical protein